MFVLTVLIKIVELIFWILLSALATTGIMFLLFLYCKLTGTDIYKRH